eukprot:1177710-Rhodomonas_salina.1
MSSTELAFAGTEMPPTWVTFLYFPTDLLRDVRHEFLPPTWATPILLRTCHEMAGTDRAYGVPRRVVASQLFAGC